MVLMSHKGYVFGVTEIASAFSERSKEDAWRHLTQEVSNKPVLFWGWNFEDAGPIEAMYGEDSDINNNIYRWVLLYEKNAETFAEYMIPNNDNKLISYPFEEYFAEYSPRWSYIYSNQIYRTIHYRKIVDAITKNQDVIVIGMRATGKTTLMMQLLVDYQTDKMKHYMINPSLEQVKKYLARLNGRKSLLFVDDCLRDTYAMIKLLECRNVQVVGFERDFSYEGQYLRLKNLPFVHKE